jgi:sulfur carrier protein
MNVLKINGKEHTYPDEKMPGSLSGLLEELGIDQATVVAEVDGTIVERKNFAAYKLKDKQNIELIRFVGGG